MNRTDILKTNTLLVLALLIAYLLFPAQWLLWAATLLAAGNAFESRATAAVARWWMRFATLMGNINSRILLAFMFFLVLTPIAWLYRFFNREKVDHFLKNRRSSYFDDIGKSYTREDFEKLW